MTTLITRNTTIPTRKSEVFSTATDSQTSVEVHVLQGERPMARDNRTLGRFHLVGLPPAPRGVPQVEVAFDIDANGIVNVTATDKATGKEQKITISGSSGLSKADVDRMVKDAASHEAEDKQRREVIDARNQADALAYQAEKTVNENREKVPVGDLSTLEAAIEAAKRPPLATTWRPSSGAPRNCSAQPTRLRSCSTRARRASQDRATPAQRPARARVSRTARSSTRSTRRRCNSRAGRMDDHPAAQTRLNIIARRKKWLSFVGPTSSGSSRSCRIA
jgi:molecular chaperone DnaK